MGSGISSISVDVLLSVFRVFLEYFYCFFFLFVVACFVAFLLVCCLMDCGFLGGWLIVLGSLVIGLYWNGVWCRCALLVLCAVFLSLSSVCFSFFLYAVCLAFVLLLRVYYRYCLIVSSCPLCDPVCRYLLVYLILLLVPYFGWLLVFFSYSSVPILD